jgi:hypothetical protein
VRRLDAALPFAQFRCIGTNPARLVSLASSGILTFSQDSVAARRLLDWLSHRWAHITLVIVFLLFLLLFVGV